MKNNKRGQQKRKNAATETIMIISFRRLVFGFCLAAPMGHSGSFNFGTPPQSLVFPITNTALAF